MLPDRPITLTGRLTFPEMVRPERSHQLFAVALGFDFEPFRAAIDEARLRTQLLADLLKEAAATKWPTPETGFYIGDNARLYGKKADLSPGPYHGTVHASFYEYDEDGWLEDGEEGVYFRCNFLVEPPRSDRYLFPQENRSRVFTQAPEFDHERMEYPEIRTDWLEVADQGDIGYPMSEGHRIIAQYEGTIPDAYADDPRTCLQRHLDAMNADLHTTFCIPPELLSAGPRWARERAFTARQDDWLAQAMAR